MEDFKFQHDWKEIKRILQDTGTSHFEIADRVVEFMDAIEARNLTKILKALKKKEEILLYGYNKKSQGAFMEVKTADDWIKTGEISGSKEEIETALKALKRIPKDADELQREITRQIKEGLGEVLRKADEQHRYTPY